MKQHRLASIVLILAFLAVVDAHAQAIVDGQPSVLREDKGQSNYVYDLKLLIKKSKDNIKSVNDKIKEQAIIKRNQQREEKAREYYQQALKLQEEGRLEEARQLFDKAIRITEHPEMQYYIKESERRSKLQEAALERQESDQERRLTDDQKLLMDRAESSYSTAVTLYKQQKFREAKDEFQLVDEMYPDYKAVRSYLQILEQDIIQSEQLGLKEQKKEIDRQQKEEEIARLREKELWRKEIDKKEEERKEQLRQQAQKVYDDAIKLYNEHKYMAARDKFQEVEWVVPDFKATRAYMTRIENDVQDEKKQISVERQRELEKQRWQEVLDEKKAAEDRRKAIELRDQEKLVQVKDQAEFVYQAAVVLFEKELFAQAKDRFDEVEGIYPNYKSVRDYLKRIDQASKDAADREVLKKKLEEERKGWEEELGRRKEEKEKFKQAINEADSSYEDAVRLYQTSRLIEAKEKFLEVDARVPDYKSTRGYLKRIDEDIELLVKTQRSQESLAAQREELDKMRMMREKAEVVYSQALAAYDNKDFVTAKAKFQEVDGIFPDLKKTKYYLNCIDEDIRAGEEARARMVREKEADSAYAQALAFYQAGQFEEAKKKFVAVETVLANYKQTSDYLEHIDDDILRKKIADLERAKEDQVRGVYNQAMALYDSGALSDAKEKFIQVEVIYPGYKETTRILGVIDVQIDRQKKEASQRQRMDEAEKSYTQALALYAAGDFLGAKEKFIKVEVVVPDYKETPKYLARIDGDIARKKREEDLRARAQEVEPLYAQGTSLYKEADFIEARKKFIQVQAILPGYKDVGLYLSRIEKDIRDQEARVSQEERSRQAETLYGEAVQLYVNRKFVEAKTRFFELTSVDPAYKNVKTYLARIDADIREEANRQAMAASEQQASEPYAQAVTLYHDGDFEGAKVKLLEVARIAPDHKKTKFYLSRVDDDIRAKARAQEKERLAKVEIIYKEATAFMASGKTVEALAKFNEVEAVYPDYKAVRSNIEKLRKTTPVPVEKTGVMSSAAVAKPLNSEKPVLLTSPDDQVMMIYKEAVESFKNKKYDKARTKFEEVAKTKPGYRSTQQYLDSIRGIQESPGKVEAKVKTMIQPMPAALVAKAPLIVTEVRSEVRSEAAPKEKIISRVSPVSPEETETIAALAARSSAIYDQIKSLSEDKELASAARTFAKVDRVLETLDVEHRRIADEIARQKKVEEEMASRAKRQEKEEVERQAKLAVVQAEFLKRKEKGKAQEEAEARQVQLMKEQAQRRKKERVELERLRDEQREAQLKTEVLYQQAQTFMRQKNYDAARERLMDVEKNVPDYKDTSKLITLIERANDEVKLTEEDGKDLESVKVLAQKATAVNMELLELSQKKEYEAVEKRFSDLESILNEIKGIKVRMVERRDQFASRWEKKAQDRKAEANKRLAPKAVKEGEDFISARQKATAIFREGEQLYALEKFAEARVKFVEALQVDPTYKAAMSYVNRLDRILSKKDFEALQKKGKEPEVSASASSTFPAVPTLPVTDLKRALQVSEEGESLYKTKRYREAKIKFEELSQVGEEADKRRAKRYLGLIDQALEKESKKAEDERRVQKERFLEERRAQAKLQWARDKNEQEREHRKVQELAAAQKELDIRRQQELRAIERENYSQRRNMIEKENREFAKVVSDARQEHTKFMGEAGQEKLPADLKTAQEKVNDERAQAQRIAQETKAGLTDAGAEAVAQEKIQDEPNRVARKISAVESREKARVEAKTDRQRHRLDQLETREQRLERERRTREEQKLKKIRRQEEEKRKAVETFVKEKNPSKKEEVVAEKPSTQQDFIRRNQEAVEAILKEPLAAPADGAIPVVEEDPSTVLLKAAVVEEKRRLEEQRQAIRKDFEDGVDRLYKEAVSLFKQKLYDEARPSFEQVDALIKGYKKTGQYLKELDRLSPKGPQDVTKDHSL